jgi:hypothetical protein
MAERGITSFLNQPSNLIENTIREYLEVDSTDEMIYREITRIANQLSLILDAPYREAVMHFREGNLEKCKARLKRRF